MKSEIVGRCFSRISILCIIVMLLAAGTAVYGAAPVEAEEDFSTLPFLYIPIPSLPPPPEPEPTETLPFLYIPIPPPPAPNQGQDGYGLDDTPYVKVLHEPIPLARCYFKAWMDFRAIRNQNSQQWRMQQLAYTCEDGFRRVNGMPLIAMGTYFIEYGVGDVFEITLSSGVRFRAVIGDVKDDRHTDPTNRFHGVNGSVIEFIIDREVMSWDILSTGNIAFAGFPGYVVSVKRLPELFIDVSEAS